MQQVLQLHAGYSDRIMPKAACQRWDLYRSLTEQSNGQPISLRSVVDSTVLFCQMWLIYISYKSV